MRNPLGFVKQTWLRNLITKTMSPEKPCSKLYNVTDPDALNFARECLLAGEVIALPTDTVYGLACDANNEKAVQKLYEIKGRDFQKPVAIYVKDLTDFRRYGKAEHLSDALLEELLPGPLTIIVERTKFLNNRFLNPSTNKVGIRNTDFEFLQRLSSLCDGQPMALTSANRSSQPSTLNVWEFSELWPKLGGVFDAGQIGLTEGMLNTVIKKAEATKRRSASTVVDLSVPGHYRVVREGVAYKPTLDVLHKYDFQKLGI